MREIFLIGLFFCCFPLESFSVQTYGNIVVKRIVSVYDGDTFTVDIQGLHPIIGKKVGIRVYGIDTPEMRSPDASERLLALKAREFVRKTLYSANKVELRDISRGKYFRIVAKVYVDGKYLTKMLIDNGYGVEYYGGKKKKFLIKKRLKNFSDTICRYHERKY